LLLFSKKEGLASLLWRGLKAAAGGGAGGIVAAPVHYAGAAGQVGTEQPRYQRKGRERQGGPAHGDQQNQFHFAPQNLWRRRCSTAAATVQAVLQCEHYGRIAQLRRLSAGLSRSAFRSKNQLARQLRRRSNVCRSRIG
jgi:hypothetical protein